LHPFHFISCLDTKNCLPVMGTEVKPDGHCYICKVRVIFM
jgi:hypothetical protein